LWRCFGHKGREMHKEQEVEPLSGEDLRKMVGSWDVVGDIAIVVIPEKLVMQERLIGEAILRSNRKLKVVARRKSTYGGEFRTTSLKILAGEHRTETETREFGVRLRLDIEKVYYSVRSSSERYRIASLVEKSEEILIPFSGVGPCPLVISRSASPDSVTGIEKNPVAHEYALQNLELNKNLRQSVRFCCGDVQEVLSQLTGSFDRIIMPLPTAGGQFLVDLLPRLKTGGWLHYYSMEKKGDFAHALQTVSKVVQALGRNILESSLHKTGHCAPHTYRICVDAKID